MNTFELTRVWTLLTGLVLTVSYFVALALGYPIPELLPMMAVAIGGFEIVLFGQDIVAKRRNSRG